MKAARGEGRGARGDEKAAAPGLLSPDIGIEARGTKSASPEDHSIRSHRDLLVWQRGIKLVERVFAMARNHADDARELVWQLHRAAISVPANIAEGRGRRGSREFSRFLSIARGSLMELDTLVEIGRRLHFFDSSITTPMETEIVELSRMIAALQRRLTPIHKSGGNDGSARS